MATNTNIGTAGAGLLSLPNMATVTTTPGGVASYLGQGMAPNSVFPRLPNLEFYARGVGRNSLIEHVPPSDPRFIRGSRIAGVQGTLEVYAQLGATGTARNLCFLTDVEGSSNVIRLQVASNNAPNVTITDHLGVTVAATNNTTALASGVRIKLRVAWNSVDPVSGANYVTVSLNGEAIAAFTTAPTTAWTYFKPTLLMLAAAQGGLSDFNGTIEVVQASNTVSP